MIESTSAKKRKKLEIMMGNQNEYCFSLLSDKKSILLIVRIQKSILCLYFSVYIILDD